MKDIKSYVIGFLTCCCLFLIMGQTKSGGNVEFDNITAKSVTVSEYISIKKDLFIGDGCKSVFVSNGGISIQNKCVNPDRPTLGSSSLGHTGLSFSDEDGETIRRYGTP